MAGSKISYYIEGARSQTLQLLAYSVAYSLQTADINLTTRRSEDMPKTQVNARGEKGESEFLELRQKAVGLGIVTEHVTSLNYVNKKLSKHRENPKNLDLYPMDGLILLLTKVDRKPPKNLKRQDLVTLTNKAIEDKVLRLDSEYESEEESHPKKQRLGSVVVRNRRGKSKSDEEEDSGYGTEGKNEESQLKKHKRLSFVEEDPGYKREKGRVRRSSLDKERVGRKTKKHNVITP